MPRFMHHAHSLSAAPAPRARRSPRSSAPRDERRFAADAANRRSPPTSVSAMRYTGADDWLDRWERPNLGRKEMES